MRTRKNIFYFAIQSTFMQNQQDQLDALRDIRNMMERSSRFLSLSGIAGIMVGVIGLSTTVIGYRYLGNRFSLNEYTDTHYNNWGLGFGVFILLLGITSLSLSLSVAIGFTARRTIRRGQTLRTKSFSQLFLNFVVPASVGGLACLILWYRDYYELILPLSELFFGLACVNASRYTYENLRNLGYVFLGLGLLSLWLKTYTLLFWGAGFGLSILIYGIILYNKYERYD